MLFNSFQYWIFFLIVALLFYSMPFRFSKILLLLASYVFYMWWDPRFIVLILTSTVVDYFLGILLETATGRRNASRRCTPRCVPDRRSESWPLR